jgi:hypothetical protein
MDGESGGSPEMGPGDRRNVFTRVYGHPLCMFAQIDNHLCPVNVGPKTAPPFRSREGLKDLSV